MKRIMNIKGNGEWSVDGKDSSKAFDRLTAIEDILGDDYDLDRLRELVEADRDERCLILPVGFADTVYHITTCDNFMPILDGDYETATGSYCPYELTERCPFPPDEFECEKYRNTPAIFEDTLESWHADRFNEYAIFTHSGLAYIDDFGKTVFTTREAAEAALKGEANG